MSEHEQVQDSSVPDDHSTSDPDFRSPSAQRIGHYRLLQRIGEGGMGEVWLADQTEPIRRRVAIKVIKRGLDTDSVIARFELERQALAMMDHPSVAKILDAGSTPDGRPYFVMDYVQGEPITTYCDRHRLSIRERLALFQQVCEGVQHAHQKGIIHRDLKPTNVLVTLASGTAQPKVIDFGVAKATQQQLTERTLFTEFGMMVGTLEYMSPEQAAASGLDIDTRSDVYGLGVMLYELLAGSLPFPPSDLREAGGETMRLRILEVDPPRPSDRLSSAGTQGPAIATSRATDPGTLAGSLRGDLDWITMKTLEKDRTRRYGSPSELAADIGRHLRDEPVLARPPSVVYRTKKLIRRHRIAVTLAVVGLVGLVGFAGTMAWQARRVAKERTRAEWVSQFLIGLFLAPDPTVAQGREVTARELLDRGAVRIETELAADPSLRARVMAMLGRTYEGLGAYDKAERMLEQALTIQREQLGTDDRETIGSLHNLALLAWDLGHYPEAEARYREAIAAGRRTLGERDPLTLTSMGNLANTVMALGRIAEAESLQSRVLELRREVRGPEHLETLSAAVDLARVWQQQGRYADAEPLMRTTVETMERVLGDEHLQTLQARYNLALILNQLGRYDDAEPIYGETVEGMRRVLGADHPTTLVGVTGLAMNYANQRRFAEAAQLLRDALDGQRRVLGEHHPLTVNTLYNLGCLAALEGNRVRALSWIEQAIERGYFDADWMSRDTDLVSLHGDPAFETLVDRARANAAALAARSPSDSV